LFIVVCYPRLQPFIGLTPPFVRPSKTDKKINFYVAYETSVMSEAGKSATEGVKIDSQKIDKC